MSSAAVQWPVNLSLLSLVQQNVWVTRESRVFKRRFPQRRFVRCRRVFNAAAFEAETEWSNKPNNATKGVLQFPYVFHQTLRLCLFFMTEFLIVIFSSKSPHRQRSPWRQDPHFLLPLGPLNLWPHLPFRILVHPVLVPRWACLHLLTEWQG